MVMDKVDRTRLKNLLTAYRDDIITNRAIHMENVGSGRAVDAVSEVDRAIFVIKDGLVKRNRLKKVI